MLNVLKKGVYLLSLLMVAPVFANTATFADGSPQHSVLTTTSGLLNLIESERDNFAKDPESVYKKFDVAVASSVDFRIMARLVMGKHYKDATLDQKKAFVGFFKQSLIRTYVAGLMAIKLKDLKVLPARDGDIDLEKGRGKVRMEVYTSTGTKALVNFAVYKHKKTNEWRITNFILNGINIGKSFKNLFDESFEANNNDLAKTISGWSAKQQANDDERAKKGA